MVEIKSKYFKKGKNTMQLLKSFFILGILFLFIGCSAKHPPLETVSQVDIKKYTGTWYEIARFEHFFEENCKNVTATYQLREDQKIRVINKCTDITSNEKKEAVGVAYATDSSNSKLKVSFFRPFYGDYWILDLEENYDYVLVGSPSRELLWILSRTKTLSQDKKDKLLAKLPALQFDPKKFIWTIQE